MLIQTQPPRLEDISHITMTRTGGATKAAERISHALEINGATSRMWYLEMSNSPKSRKLIQKCLDRIERFANSKNENDYNFTFFKSWNANLNLSKNQTMGSVTNFHWIPGIFPSNLIKQTRKSANFLTVHDMNQFTGGCHHSLGCTRFETGCGKCPGSTGPVHDFVPLSYKLKRIQINQLQLKGLICPSDWILKQATKSEFFRNIPKIMIPNPVPMDKFFPIIHSVTTPENLDIRIGILGSNYIESKKSDIALREVEEFQKRINRSVTLYIIGDAHRDTSLTQMCLLPPGSPEMSVAEIMRQLDVLVFTSNADTAPQLLSEAQASGVPVVARHAGGVGEMFVDQLSGFLVDGDAGSVAAALENLFETREKLSHFKVNSHKFAIKKFSYKATAEEYLKFYKENLSLI